MPDRSRLRDYLEANRVFLQLQEEINASLINTFLGVALWGYEEGREEPLTIKEISSRIGLPYTTISRHLRYLGVQRRIGVEGMGLMDTKVHDMDRRQKTVFLTTKGKALRDQLLFILGEDDDGQTTTGKLSGNGSRREGS